MKTTYFIGLFASFMLTGTGCKTMTPQNKQMFAMQTGGMIGSVSGTLLGDRIGGWGGSLIGSVVGGVAGSALGAAAANPYKEQPAQTSRPEEREVPQLVIKDILLTDENRDGTLEAGEHAHLTFIIHNNGSKNIRQLLPALKGKKEAKRIRNSEVIPITNIKPGEEIRYRINLLGSSQLKGGKAVYQISLNDSQGQTLYEEEFSFPTQK